MLNDAWTRICLTLTPAMSSCTMNNIIGYSRNKKGETIYDLILIGEWHSCHLIWIRVARISWKVCEYCCARAHAIVHVAIFLYFYILQVARNKEFFWDKNFECVFESWRWEPIFSLSIWYESLSWTLDSRLLLIAVLIAQFNFIVTSSVIVSWKLSLIDNTIDEIVLN
jgi:hypothetical protein